MLVMAHLPLRLTVLNIFSRAYLKIRSSSFCFMIVAPFPLLYAKMVAKAAQISEDVTSWHEQVFWSHNLPAQHLSSARCCHLLANYIVHISIQFKYISVPLQKWAWRNVMVSTAQFSDVWTFCVNSISVNKSCKEREKMFYQLSLHHSSIRNSVNVMLQCILRAFLSMDHILFLCQ